MEMPMYLMQEDEGNDEEIMRLLGVSNSSPSSSNLSESSSDSGNGSSMQLSDSMAGDQMGDLDCASTGMGFESASGCGSETGDRIMEVLGGKLCSPEILDQLMLMEIDCGDVHDDVVTARSLEELVSQVATGTFDQSATRTNWTAPVNINITSDHQFHSEAGPISSDGNSPEKVLPTREDQDVSLSSRAKLSLPVRQSSPASDSGSAETSFLTPSEPSVSPVTPSGSGSPSVMPIDQEGLPIRPIPLPAFPAYSVAVPMVDLASSGPESTVLTLQATPILSVEHTACVPEAHRRKHSTTVSPGQHVAGYHRSSEWK